MSKKEYLAEENYNKTKNKISFVEKLIVTILWIVSLELIGVSISVIIKYNDKEMLNVEEQKLIKIQEELEIKLDPIEEKIKKLESFNFTGFDDDYYARKDRIEELKKV